MVLAALSSCDVDAPPQSDDARAAPGPPVRVLGVEATVAYLEGQPQYAELTEDGVLSGVTRTASLRIRFDRFLLPHRIIRQSLCVRPAVEDVDSIEECQEPFQAFTEPEYNPVERSVTYRLGLGDRFEAQTRYRVSIFVPPADEAGFYAFDGAPLARKYVFDFETQPAGGEEVQEVLPSKEAYCEAIACFEACDGSSACIAGCRCVEPTCAFSGDLLSGGGSGAPLFNTCAEGACHAPADPVDPQADDLTMGLDLSTVSGVQTTALAKVAHQTQYGEDAASAEQSPERFGRAMPLIDPLNPGHSYLLYKLLANPLNHPRGADGRLDPFLATELERLRESVVVGLPMPASTDGEPRGIFEPASDPTGELSHQHLLLIDAWIANGAVISCD